MKIIYRDRGWELTGRMTVRQAIEQVGLIPETVLAVREGKLLTEDTMLEPEDTIKWVSVVPEDGRCRSLPKATGTFWGTYGAGQKTTRPPVRSVWASYWFPPASSTTR